MAVLRPSPPVRPGTCSYYCKQATPGVSLRQGRNHNHSYVSWLKLEERSVLITHSRLALSLNSVTSPLCSIFQLSLFSPQKHHTLISRQIGLRKAHKQFLLEFFLFGVLFMLLIKESWQKTDKHLNNSARIVAYWRAFSLQMTLMGQRSVVMGIEMG